MSFLKNKDNCPPKRLIAIHKKAHRRRLGPKQKKAMYRIAIILTLATIGLLVRLTFFGDLFTQSQQIQAFIISLFVIFFMWLGLEKINFFLNQKLPYSNGLMRRIAVQFIIGQIFLYSFLFLQMLIIIPFLRDVELNREIIFSALVVYLLINISANSGIIGHHFFLEWKKSLVTQSLLEKEKTQAHFANLKNQLNPHFLFNSLSSLNSLIFENPALASKFLKQLSKVYRYLLENNENDPVTLETEINFVQNYILLLQTRFDGGLIVNIDVNDDGRHKKIIPVTLQILIENAIKHNSTFEDNPLIINIYIHNNYLVIKNNQQPKTRVEGSNKQGLNNLVSLYQYTTGYTANIHNTQEHFIVEVPLID